MIEVYKELNIVQKNAFKYFIKSEKDVLLNIYSHKYYFPFRYIIYAAQILLTYFAFDVISLLIGSSLNSYMDITISSDIFSLFTYLALFISVFMVILYESVIFHKNKMNIAALVASYCEHTEQKQKVGYKGFFSIWHRPFYARLITYVLTGVLFLFLFQVFYVINTFEYMQQANVNFITNDMEQNIKVDFIIFIFYELAIFFLIEVSIFYKRKRLRFA